MSNERNEMRKRRRKEERSLDVLLFDENASALANLCHNYGAEDSGEEDIDENDVEVTEENVKSPRNATGDAGNHSFSENMSMCWDDQQFSTKTCSVSLPVDETDFVQEDISHEVSYEFTSVQTVTADELLLPENLSQPCESHCNPLCCDTFPSGERLSQAVEDLSCLSESDGEESLSIENGEASATSPLPEKVVDFRITKTDVSAEVWKILTGGEEISPEELFKIQVARWASKFLVKRNAVDELLHLLKENGHPDLPSCAKTLLKTPRSSAKLIQNIAGGQFWYRGIENALKVHLKKELLQDGSVIIDIFVDGLSPHKSVRRHLWPIAGCISGDNTVFVIALWCGTTKEPTSVDEFLNNFVNEASHLLENGVRFQELRVKFVIGKFIADAPARAWMRKVRSHNSYYSCERCTIRGEWKFRRITYNPAEEAPLRTDESFEKQTHREYHLGFCTLLLLFIKMISQFPLDVMHLVFLGIVKRLYTLLLQKKAGRFKLPHEDVKKLDALCDVLHKFCPSDFARKPRKLSDYKLFKATEFRRLLLYDGFILQKNHKHKDVYECFLLLACAMRILLDSHLRALYSSDAHDLLVRFVKKSYRVLGSSFVVYNVHHLIHLVADCDLHGDPESFSCFKYETSLGQLKNFLLAPGRTLQQIMCRIIERSVMPPSPPVIHVEKKLFEPHAHGPVLDCVGNQFAGANMLGSVIRIATDTPRDSCVLTASGSVVVVENIVESDSDVYLLGRKFLNHSDYFKYPFQSSLLNIFQVSELGPLEKWNIINIKQKVVFYPLTVDGNTDTFNWRENHGLCIPLLHSEPK